MSPASSRRTQGVARYTFLIVLTLVVIGGVVIFWQIKSRAAADDPAPTVVVAAGPVVREGAGTDELLQHARQAMADQRLLAPAGNNAFELYLTVLKREPGNRAAQDALREIFPFAAHAAEQVIDDGNITEAQREIELLARADPQNYTLTLLQSKLQAQQAADAQQAQQAQSPGKHELPSSATAGASRVPVPAAAPPQAMPIAPPVTQPAVATKPASTLTPAEQALAQLHVESTPVEAAPRAAVKPRAPAVATVDTNGAAAPVLTHRVEPAYPAEARRTRRQGWVDVTFTVQADGSVTGANVVDADPKYVFDRAALFAVARWQFTPGSQDGKPVPAQVRQRIEFRL
ncbi:energy transducer TonB [Dyella sp. 20L07]|uniref:energy transducer TonB n=1 Tax=Dyella sp. 20L07 TaxID=3384240 RepID=UPI003D2743C8